MSEQLVAATTPNVKNIDSSLFQRLKREEILIEIFNIDGMNMGSKVFCYGKIDFQVYIFVCDT